MSTSEAAAPAGGGLPKRQAGAIAAASAIGALSNFVLMFIAARALSDADNAEFLVFWSLLTGMFGVVVGVQQETTRAVGSVVAAPASARDRFLPAGLTVGAGVALLIALAWPVLSGTLLARSSAVAVPLLVVATLLQVTYVSLIGALAGHGHWDGYAGLLTAETVLRMTLIGVVALAWPTLASFELAAAGGVLVLAAAVVFWPRARATLTGPSDRPRRRLTINYTWAALSTSATAVLITGFPAIMKATNLHADPTELAALILTVSLTRAPIMMPLTTFQGVAVKAFLARRDAPVRAALMPIGALLTLGMVGAGAAWLLGPWFLTLFKPEYQVAGWVFAALTLSSAFMAALTLFGTLALTMDAHAVFAAGWIVASVTAVAILLLDAPLAIITTAALAVAPLLGSLVFVVFLALRARRPGPTSGA